METVVLVLFLLTVVVISGAIAHAMPFPVPVPLVQIACGALAGLFIDQYAILLHPQLFFILFLPPLLFLDGWRISKQALARNRWLVLSLAFGLVLVTVLGGGLLMHSLFPSVPLAICFAFTAVLSPTDPIAVSAITGKLPLPKRLMDVLEGEALLNDASGLVCMKLAIGAALTGYFSLSEAAILLVWSSVAGLAVGIGVTYVMTYIFRWWARQFGEEPGTVILTSLLTPFAAYFMGDLVGASAILAAVGAGFAVTYAEGISSLDSSVRVRRVVIWDAVQAITNGTIFILLGQQLPFIIRNVSFGISENLVSYYLWLVAWVFFIYLVLFIFRFLWLFILLQLPWFKLRLTNPGALWKNFIKFICIASFAGVRGVITLAGILTLPYVLHNGFLLEDRAVLIFVATGVIIFSLVVATIALPLLLRNSNFILEGANEEQLEIFAKISATNAAVLAVEKSVQSWAANKQGKSELYNLASLRVLESYKQKSDDLTAEREDKQDIATLLQYERKLRVLALKAERKTFYNFYKEKKLSEESMDKFLRELDLQESRISK